MPLARRVCSPVRPSSRRGEAGFTLLEVMIALGIFSIGFVGVVALQLSVANNARVAADISLASNLASDRIERMRVANFNTGVVPAVEYYDRQGDPNDSAGNPLTATSPQKRFIVTTLVGDVPGNNYKEVTVTTTWTYGTTGRTHEIRLFSRIIQ